MIEILYKLVGKMTGKFLSISSDKLDLLQTILERRLPNSATIFNIAKLTVENRYSQNVATTFYTYNGVIDEEALIIVVLRRKFLTEEDSQVTFSAPPSLTLKDKMPGEMLAAFEAVMDWTVSIAFCSVDERVANYIQLSEMCSRVGILSDSDLCDLYVCDIKDALQLYISPGQADGDDSCITVSTSTLSPQDAQIVIDHWNYSGKGVGGVEKMQDVIRNIGSAGVYLKDSSKTENGDKRKELVSWVVTSHVGCINALFTHQGHRRKGYGKLVMEAITKFNARDGLQPVVQISRNNHASKDLMEQIGYHHSHPMMWVIYRPHT